MSDMNPFLSKKGNSSGGVYPEFSVFRIYWGCEWSFSIRFCVCCVSDELAKKFLHNFSMWLSIRMMLALFRRVLFL